MPSVVLLYTDGLIERRGEDLARGLAPDGADDVALIAVRTPALPEGPAPALAE